MRDFKFLLCTITLLVSFNSQAQIDMTDVSPSNVAGVTEGEAHLSISKAYPGNLVLSSMTGNNVGYLTQVSRFLSNDYAQTWTGYEYTSSSRNYADPTTSFDADGNAYMIELFGCGQGLSIQKCTNPRSGTSAVWPAETDIINGSCGDVDKEMMVIDNLPGSPYLNNLYMAYAVSAASVYFQRLVSGNTTFDPATNIGFGRGPHLQTGPDGDVYVIWIQSESWHSNPFTTRIMSYFGFAHSSNGGSTFDFKTFDNLSNPNLPFKSMSYTDTAFINKQIAQTSPTVVVSNNTQNFPYMAIDKSCKPSNSHRGRIYITYPYLTNQSPIRSEIRFRYSDDKGTTWSTEKTVSTSAALNCYYPFIAVDDATGDVLIKYQTIEDASFTNNVYLASSSDGGTTFTTTKVNGTSFTSYPVSSGGHYYGLAAYGGIAYPMWSDNHTTVEKNWISPVKFSSPTYYTSSTNLNINGPLVVSTVSTSVNYTATQSISAPAASNTMNVPSGANVFLTAGSSISFVPGFSSNIGANLLATIGTSSPCMSTISRIADASTNSTDQEFSSREYKQPEVLTYPNPFWESLSFKYELDEDAIIDIRLYDETGKEVAVITESKKESKGLKEISYDSANLAGGETYLYVVKIGSKIYRGKLMKVTVRTGGQEEEEFEDYDLKK